MNRFLHHLTGKATGASRVVTPILPAIFEPSSGFTELPLEGPSATSLSRSVSALSADAPVLHYTKHTADTTLHETERTVHVREVKHKENDVPSTSATPPRNEPKPSRPQLEPERKVVYQPSLAVRTIAAAPPTRPTEQRAEPARPHIHVNIGRVEVRANTPGVPQPAPQAPTRRNGVSLEEYLRLRS